jgi:hypothetical protein
MYLAHFVMKLLIKIAFISFTLTVFSYGRGLNSGLNSTFGELAISMQNGASQLALGNLEENRDFSENQIKKRSHKRRRKVRPPKKGR